jgi:charged multivesicular body protein 6
LACYEQTSQIEFALVEKDILEGLRQGNAVLKSIQKEMSLESVEKLMEENADAIAYQKEVSEMLAGHMSNADEDEVEDELEAMEREVLAERAAVTPRVDMPSVPTKEPVRTQEEDRVAQEKARRKARAEKRKLEAQAQPEPEPMLA